MTSSHACCSCRDGVHGNSTSPPTSYEVMHSCWSPVPRCRPSFQRLLEQLEGLGAGVSPPPTKEPQLYVNLEGEEQGVESDWLMTSSAAMAIGGDYRYIMGPCGDGEEGGSRDPLQDLQDEEDDGRHSCLRSDWSTFCSVPLLSTATFCSDPSHLLLLPVQPLPPTALPVQPPSRLLLLPVQPLPFYCYFLFSPSHLLLYLFSPPPIYCYFLFSPPPTYCYFLFTSLSNLLLLLFSPPPLPPTSTSCL